MSITLNLLRSTRNLRRDRITDIEREVLIQNIENTKSKKQKKKLIKESEGSEERCPLEINFMTVMVM